MLFYQQEEIKKFIIIVKQILNLEINLIIFINIIINNLIFNYYYYDFIQMIITYLMYIKENYLSIIFNYSRLFLMEFQLPMKNDQMTNIYHS